MSLEAFARFCGVDVSERQLDVHLLPDGASSSFAHTEAGIGTLTAASLLALLPELGRLDGKSVARLPASRRLPATAG